MRALAQHDAYFVPIGLAARFGRTEFDRMVQLSAQGGPPPGEVYVFSDESCLDLVVKTPLGNFVTPVSGVEWLTHLDPRQDVKVKVNPGGPQAHFWYMGKDAVPLAKLWGEAVELEQLMVKNDQVALAATLRRFTAFTILALPSGAVATAPGAGNYENPAMIFTAPDCFQKVLASEPLAGLRPVHVTGKELFELLPRAGVDGMVFNPLGPGVAAAYPLALINRVLMLS
ncbi:MAG: hypothetical protein U0228_03485 [Myxococcaceae bacterium]